MLNLSRLKKRIYSANAKILNAEKRYGKDSGIVKRAYSTIEMIYGKGVTRYRMPKSDSLRELSKIDRALSLVERSKYMSKAGRKEIREKSMMKFISKGYDPVTIEKLFDIFENNTDWDRIRELAGRGKSELVVNAIDNYLTEGAETADVDEIISQYMERLKDGTDEDFIEYFYDVQHVQDRAKNEYSKLEQDEITMTESEYILNALREAGLFT